MTRAPPRSGGARTLGRFLEIQNLGLNLPFAIAFLFAAARGVPSLVTIGLIVVAFVAARNAGHSFNRWADRAQDAANPRTQERALVTGRLSARFALGFAFANGAVLILAAFFLNRLAFFLAPVALALVFGYSYTKRYTALTTPFLGLVEAAAPGAIFIAVQGTLSPVALVAVAGMIAWGTAFETIHSLGDLASDRALRLRSLPLALGVRRSLYLLPVLHGAAIVAFFGFGWLLGFGRIFWVALATMAILAGITDYEVARRPSAAERPFRRHFALGAIFLAGVLAALFLPSY